MSWFEEWFDSPLYEKMYANRDDKEAAQLADLLKEVMPAEQYSEILDLGCGRGRHSINFAERGYHVTGIDLSEVAIQKARSKAKKMNLDIEFIVGDMRKPLDRTFDGIINLFTSFGYFRDDEENRKVLRAMQKMLRTDGLLVIDYLNAEKVKKDIESYDEGTIDHIEYEIHRFLEDDTVNKKMIFQFDDNGKTREYQERVKLYNLDWFREKMKACHLVIKQVYGEYDGQAYDPDESSRLIMICQKDS